MPAAVQLPLFSPPPPPDAALGCGAGVEYLRLPCKSALNRAGGRLEGALTVNPYRGCELGCAYCYARYTHRYFDAESEGSFDRRIFVKDEAPRRLAAELRRLDPRDGTLAFGSATDPYQPAERRFGVTRGLLEALLPAEGLDVRIVTKSALVARDATLLGTLARRHRVTVLVSLISLDRALLRALEPRAPTPELRLAAGARLAAAGVAWGILAAPALPGLTDGPDDLLALLAAAKAAGATTASVNPLFLRRGARERFFRWLGLHDPGHLAAYRAAYRRERLADEPRGAIRRRFDVAAAQAGIARGEL